MIQVIDFGLKDYNEVLDLQTKLFNELIERKVAGRDGKNGDKESKGDEYILIGEHYPVITLGRRAKEENILFSKGELEKKEVKVYHIGRGGDVTYHCPGQLIVYPILDLEKHHLGVKDFVDLMEETVIRLIEKYGIKGERVAGATGVWVGKGTDQERKICAMGIKCSRYCTMHGLALNVTSDLSGFTMINPCGFQDKGVTSLEKEILFEISSKTSDIGENKLKIDKVKKDFLDIFFSLIFPL